MLNSILYKASSFLRSEAVLCIAFLCAVASCAFVEKDHDSFASVDMRVLVLLFCLMASVNGLQKAGILARCAHLLVARAKGLRALSVSLVALPFFASMFVTNDVALLAFVPFAIAALTMSNETRHLPRIVVLQAVAANIGGMVTPMGNPQNLFLYTTFHIPIDAFFLTLLPFASATFVALCAACFTFKERSTAPRISLGASPVDRKQAIGYAALFCLCLAAVVRLVPHQVLFAITLAALLIFDRCAFERIDYGLLATFVCFFIFSGNIAAIPAIGDILESLMETAPFITSATASQVISNVPAAVLLAGFTDNWQALLLGVDLGGLGTPIASLASLIALKLYMHTPDASLAAFLKEFTAINLTGLVALSLLYCAIFGIAAL